MQIAGEEIRHMIKLVGLNKFDFTKDGEHIQGVSCHALNDLPENDNFLGNETIKFSLSIDKFNKFLSGRNAVDLLNTIIDISYNKYGKVANIVSID